MNARFRYSQDGTQLGVKVQYTTHRQGPPVGRRSPHQGLCLLGGYTESMPPGRLTPPTRIFLKRGIRVTNRRVGG